MPVTRREVCAMLPAMLIPGVVSIEASGGEAQALPSAIYPFEKMTPHAVSGGEIREILKGKLATGESIEVHQTTLQPGGAPHPPHHHVHSEMWLIRAGTVELLVEAKSYQLGAGSVGFVKSNEEHGIRNMGTTPATYYVVEIGPGAAGA